MQIELREEATLPSRPPGFFVQSERMVEKATIFERDGKERKIAQLTGTCSILNFARIFVTYFSLVFDWIANSLQLRVPKRPLSFLSDGP